MKKILIFFEIASILSLFIFSISCNSGGGVMEFEDNRSLQNVKDDFKELDFVTGINDFNIEGTFSGIIWKFRVIVPVGASEQNKLPLIVCLHGAATIIDPELHKNTNCLEEPGFENLNVILLCPNSDGFIWYDAPQQDKVLTLTDLVKDNLPVDANKVAIMGYSDGGNGAWYYAQHHSTKFSAAIPMASSYNPVRLGSIPVKIDIPLYVIHGKNDQLFPLETTQSYIDTSIAAGTNLEFIIAPELEHYNSCAYVPYLKDAALWLENEVWN